MKYIRFCENCKNSKNNTSLPAMFLSNSYNKNVIENYFAGYIYGIQEEYWNNTDRCPFCQSKTVTLNINEEDIYILFVSSNGNRQLLDAMIDLHDKDIIEYELKMSQFRNQANQQKQQKVAQQQESNIPKCPKCGSNQITTGQRGFSIWTGFLGSNKTVNRCAKCGYSWQPGK